MPPTSHVSSLPSLHRRQHRPAPLPGHVQRPVLCPASSSSFVSTPPRWLVAPLGARPRNPSPSRLGRRHFTDAAAPPAAPPRGGCLSLLRLHLLLDLPWLLLRYIDADAYLLEARVVPFPSLGGRGLSRIARLVQSSGQLALIWSPHDIGRELGRRCCRRQGGGKTSREQRGGDACLNRVYQRSRQGRCSLSTGPCGNAIVGQGDQRDQGRCGIVSTNPADQ